MLSYHAIGASHDIQAERPVTTDRRSGTRAATTFRKLPSASPGMKTIAAATPSISRPGRVAQDDVVPQRVPLRRVGRDRKSTRLNSSHANISYAVFCLKKKKQLDIDLSFNRKHHDISLHK